MSQEKSNAASSDVISGGNTGATVSNTGPYKMSGPIEITVFLAKGDKFPPSPFPQSVETSMMKNQATPAASWTMVSSADATAVPEQ